MTNSADDKDKAIRRIYGATKKWSATAVFHTSVLVALGYAFSTGSIDSHLIEVFGIGVGVNLISDVIGRMARGEKTSDEAIQQAIQKALASTDLENLLTEVEFKRTLATLFERQGYEFALIVAESDQKLEQRLIEEMNRNQLLTAVGLRHISKQLEWGEAQHEEMLRLLRQLSPQEISFPLIYLPHPNLNFSGRVALLNTIKTSFAEKQTSIAITQTQTIAGLGGVGKTQLALAYAYQQPSKQYRHFDRWQ
jgi:hypothetical protein